MKFLSLFLLIVSPMGFAEELDVTRRNNEAVSMFKQEKYLESYETFMSLLAEAPKDPVVHFNLGVSLEAIAEEEKAQKLYVELLKLLETKMQVASEEEKAKLTSIYFATLFNLANVYSRQGEIDKALNNYQKALTIVPDSKEIKTNIELMFQQQQGGGGKGDQKNQDQEGEGEGEGQQQSPEQQPQQGQKQQKKKQKFDQSQMSMEDLKRILEELKQQEEKIRAKFQGGGKKDKQEDGASGKNW